MKFSWPFQDCKSPVTTWDLAKPLMAHIGVSVFHHILRGLPGLEGHSERDMRRLTETQCQGFRSGLLPPLNPDKA